MGRVTDGGLHVSPGEIDRLINVYGVTAGEAHDIADLIACDTDETNAVLTVRGDYVFSRIAGRPMPKAQAEKLIDGHTPKPDQSTRRKGQLRARAQAVQTSIEEARSIADMRAATVDLLAVVLEIIDLPSTRY